MAINMSEPESRYPFAEYARKLKLIDKDEPCGGSVYGSFIDWCNGIGNALDDNGQLLPPSYHNESLEPMCPICGGGSFFWGNNNAWYCDTCFVQAMLHPADLNRLLDVIEDVL